MENFRAPLLIASLAGLASVASAQHSWPDCPDVKDSEFRKVSVIDKANSNLNEPIKMAFAKDGRLFWIERAGLVKRWHPATKAVTTLVRLNPFIDNTRGGMGIALDPAFDSNGWVYVVFSVNDRTFRLARYTLAGDALGDPKVVLDVPFTAGVGQHASGAIAFDNDGNLLWGTGDMTNPHNVGSTDIGGYAPIASNQPHNDARRSSANTNDLNGKILRIHPEPNGTYTIPKGNLFPPGTALTRPEIYAMGFRNPWTAWFDKPTGWLFVGEVGPDAMTANSAKGPAAMDELNVIKGPGNFGWPFVAGRNVPYNNYDYVANRTGPLFDPNALDNTSPHNTGLKELPPARPSLFAYSHDGRAADQTRHNVMTGGARGTSISLPVYRYDPALKSSTKLPPHFDNVWFFVDWERNAFHALTLDAAAENVTAVKRPFGGISFANPIAGAIGPDGALWLIEYGNTFFSSPSIQRISRVEYTGACLPDSPVGLAQGHARAATPRLRARLDQGRIEWVTPAGEVLDAQGRR